MQAGSNDSSAGVFGQFASKWFPAMVSAVLGSAEEAEEQGIHYMLLDVCLTCLTWPTLFPAMHKRASPGLSAGVKVAADALMDYLVWPIISYHSLDMVHAVLQLFLKDFANQQALCELSL